MKSPASPPPALPRRLSLVAQTVASLSAGIRGCQWPRHLPAERELAKQLQVGRKTLRAALKELEHQGTLSVSSRQGRLISTPPPGGGSTQQRGVGILIQTPLQTMHSRRMFVIHAVRENLGKAGCLTELHVSPRCFSAHPARALDKLVRDHPGLVWVVFGSKEPMQHWFVQRRLPCLVIGSSPAGIGLPSIDVDHQASCHHAGNVLWRKGHRRVALVLPLDAFGGDAASELGLGEALEGKPGVHLRVLRHDGTQAHLRALLDQALGAAQPPTAFVVARAMQALTVAMHLMNRGRVLPRDVAVISRDDEAFMECTTPAITRYSVSLPLYARRIAMAARQLTEPGGLPPKAMRLMPAFVAGETV